ncbi:MAG: hypothetical protein LDL19_00795 [Thiobacillus sp.]|nr:hypothetical protein [Thiobacillus sp.]
MNARIWIAALMAIAGGASAAEAVSSRDRALCQGNYSVMLMTEVECRQYAQRLRQLQGQKNSDAQLALQFEHDRLLSERAASCACARDFTGPESTVLAAGDC